MVTTHCFSYPAAAPPGIGNCDAVHPDLRRMPFACFSYSSDVPRSMPWSCFSYSAETPLGVGNRAAAQPPLPGLHGMPYTCFKY